MRNWSRSWRANCLHRLAAPVVAVSLLCSCVSIPQEAPELSAELGKRLAAIEEAHIALVHRYMDEKRDKVDEFVVNTWTPIFAEEVFSSQVISDIWDEVVRSGDLNDRVKLLVRLGPKLQARINEERLAMIQPLDDLEREIIRKIRGEYRQALAINNSITSFLASAAEVAENRSRLLELVGIDESKISRVIDDADQAVAGLVEGKEKVKDRVAAFKERIGDLKKKVQES